ncbi:MAG: TetR/AcrR family transcriptional regulator [Chloroflexota bacterium]
MGRKSLAEERTNQILDAYEQCIIQHGLEGATLQRTADHANVNLGMIHHYIGRRDDLLQAMVTRLIERIQAEMDEFYRYTAEEDRLPELLVYFFESEEDQDDRVVEALYVSGGDHPAVQTALSRINGLFQSIWAQEINRLHPAQTDQRCNEIALAVLALAYSSEILTDSSMRPDMWRTAAETLINNP